MTEEQVLWAARKYLETGAEPRDLYGYIQGLTGHRVGTAEARRLAQAIITKAEQLTDPRGGD